MLSPKLFRKCNRLALLLGLLLTGLLSQANAQGPVITLQGKSSDVFLIPNTTQEAGKIRLEPDIDFDGVADAAEILFGMNPSFAGDVDEDPDGDGLSSGDEIALGTNPRVADTDGDGASDGLEVSLGYDPKNPNSTPPANPVVVSIQITPSPLGITINSIFGQQPIQLTVTGTRNTGSTVNLTADAQTTYRSLNPTIALVTSGGLVAGATAGATFIEVKYNSLTAQVPVTVVTFSPQGLSSLAIPGYANNVDVAGNYAYVAAGATGLQVVDVSSRTNPRIVGSLDTPGNANDVRVVGNLAYIADGSAGLKVANITNATSPSLAGTVDTPGEAQDVVVMNGHAYVADGVEGLAVIDVSNPSAPVLRGRVGSMTNARGVSVSGNYAVVADDQGDTSAIHIVDVSNPAAPQKVGSLNIQDSAKDVVTRNNLAYVAAFAGGIQVINFSTPTAPTLAGGLQLPTVGAFVPRDIELQGDFAFAAEQLFGNAVPIVDVRTPTIPRYRGVIDFSPLGDYAGTGIALDSRFVYMTGESFVVTEENGVNGDTRLFIGAYQTKSDSGGIAPNVALTSPTTGQSFKVGTLITLRATASDDVEVAEVQFKVNGVIYSTGATAPYEAIYRVPANVTSFTVNATAKDLGGNLASTAPVTVNVIPDTIAPTVAVTSPTSGQSVKEGSLITLTATASDDAEVAEVQLKVNGNIVSTNMVFPYQVDYRVPPHVTEITVSATARDWAGNTSVASVTVPVIDDTVAPTIVLTLPTVGTSVKEGDFLTIAATASDDEAVAEVQFKVNGIVVGTKNSVPYKMNYVVPANFAGTNSSALAPSDVIINVSATALDFGGNQASTPPRTVTVTPDASPTVSIANPTQGTQLIEGQIIQIKAFADDDEGVDRVKYVINGVEVGEADAPPYKLTITVPTGISTLNLTATAIDSIGQTATTTSGYQVIPDPKTTVSGRVLDINNQPVVNASVSILNQFTAQTGADGRFTAANIPTVRGDIFARATALLSGTSASNTSVPKAPVRGGTTDVGVIRLVTGATAPTVASLKDYDGDNTPDILVSYPDRQGWIYTTQGGQLLPSAALIPPFGAVASGGGLPNEFPTEKKVFVQLAGQPGALKAYKVDASNITNVGEIASGLTGESTSTTVGYDTFNWAGVVAYVSTTEATGTVLGVSFGAFDPDDPDADPTFGNSITLPIEPTAKVRSLLLTDVNGDGLVDLLITKPGAGNAGKVVTYLRISATEFAAPVESTVTLRTGAETKGQVDFVTGTLVGDLQPDVAVLGDDRVRLYRGNATGAFVADGEISLPAGKTPTGVQFARLSDSSLGGLLVTVRDAVAPTAKQLLAYIRTVNGFQPAVVFNYTAAVSNGDTRVLVGHWGGDAQRLDVVVVDGEKVQLILDVGPST